MVSSSQIDLLKQSLVAGLWSELTKTIGNIMLEVVPKITSPARNFFCLIVFCINPFALMQIILQTAINVLQMMDPDTRRFPMALNIIQPDGPKISETGLGHRSAKIHFEAFKGISMPTICSIQIKRFIMFNLVVGESRNMIMIIRYFIPANMMTVRKMDMLSLTGNEDDNMKFTSVLLSNDFNTL